MRADERILEEQKRHKELLARVEREAILQNENCQIKIRTIEIEAKALKEEVIDSSTYLLPFYDNTFIIPKKQKQKKPVGSTIT